MKYKYATNYCSACGKINPDYTRCKECGVAKETHKRQTEDAISRRAALREFEKDQYRLEYCKEHGIDRSISMEMVRIRLHDLPPVTPKQRWIPVSERLPKKEGEYLLWGRVTEDEEGYYSFIGDFDSDCEKFGVWEEQFDRSTLGCLGSEFFEYYKVIAWMPLPKPYKAESEEQA